MKTIFNEQVSFSSGEIKIKESVDDKKILMELNVLPFGEVSHNGVLYNKQSVLETMGQIKNLSFLDNHRIDDSIRHNPPFGHFVKAFEKNGWLKAIVDVDPSETVFINKIKRGDIKRCSLQIMAGEIKECENEKTGVMYHEAFINNWLEISAVYAPGFQNASINNIESVISEKFKGFKNNKNNLNIFSFEELKELNKLI